MASSDHHVHGMDVLREVRRPQSELRKLIPDVFEGYSALSTPVLAEGDLSTKHKELIALAIAISKQCDGCIAAHAHAANKAGATRQEVAEMIGVTFLMNGGPASVYGSRALSAFDEFHGSQD